MTVTCYVTGKLQVNGTYRDNLLKIVSHIDTRLQVTRLIDHRWSPWCTIYVVKLSTCSMLQNTDSKGIFSVRILHNINSKSSKSSAAQGTQGQDIVHEARGQLCTSTTNTANNWGESQVLIIRQFSMKTNLNGV